MKQAPRAWYYRLDKYLQDKGFKKSTIDSNLYIKYEGDNLLVVLVYLDDIILVALMIPLFSGLKITCNLSLRC